MFRNPREKPTVDIGRPPTPPGTTSTLSSANPTATVATTSTAPAVRNLRGISKTPAKSSPTRDKSNARGNASILNFFKKAEPRQEPKDEALFLSDDENENLSRALRLSKVDTHNIREADEERYNESTLSSKRQKVDAEEATEETNSRGRADAPILQEINVSNSQDMKPGSSRPIEGAGMDGDNILQTGQKGHTITTADFLPPSLPQESTSAFEDNFEGIEDFVEDEFPEDGEEHVARKWMEEQRLLELDFEDDEGVIDDAHPPPIHSESEPHKPATTCPVCGQSLEGLQDDKVSIHVNDCLDGKTTTLPSVPDPTANATDNNTAKTAEVPAYKRFQRAAVARPGQENPFSLDPSVPGKSAFSKIMASHAEDTAWATAAANEMAERGKPAFKRTCPFYKILPGFFICVDAFRYGAVEGCHAYFLSHFHSDHYVGLTSSWCHGPIYCSHVTGNLVRQQLRVDPKWVVDLEWDVKIEVPRTQGVYVTMIPANHCPGSSLFLFEKVVGRGARPKQQRVLHCGDFRACPMHVQHPLLRPELIDLATGTKSEQRLDVCYLDTTYLNPKYAFPRQEDVIQACADVCVSLSKEYVDDTDSWEQTKKERAGSGMVRFIQKEGPDGVDSAEAARPKNRGRLLVVVGTYSIGKERICVGVAKALNSKIFAAPGKQRICAALEDPELAALLTNDPREAQVHMQMLMEIRAETLADYLTGYKPHFSRIVGFRPSGWNYRPPNSRFTESPLVQTVLFSDNWKPLYSMAEMVPQRGSTREASCYGVPYSEHSSFRELTMFCCALNIDKIIPTVNVGSAKSREKMKGWIDKWAMERRKNGLYTVADDARVW